MVKERITVGPNAILLGEDDEACLVLLGVDSEYLAAALGNLLPVEAEVECDWARMQKRMQLRNVVVLNLFAMYFETLRSGCDISMIIVL